MCAATAAEQPFAPHELAKLMVLYEGVRDHLEERLLWLRSYALRIQGSLPRAARLGKDDMTATIAAIRRVLALLEGDLWRTHALPTPPLKLDLIDLPTLFSSLAREAQAISESDTRPQDEGDHPRIQANTATELPCITGDPLALRRVLENLLTNALLHGRARTVRLSAQIDGPQHVAIYVDDSTATLPSASSADLDHAPHTTWHRNSGFGMRICDRLVRAHGGTIQTHGQPATGTRVTVRLPIRGPIAPRGGDPSSRSSATWRPTWIAQALAVAEAGHDLRSPLAAVIGLCRIMQFAVDDSPDPCRWRALKTIEEQTHGLLQLVNQLLESARLATGRLRLAHDRLDAGELMRRVAAAVSPTVRDLIPVDIEVQPADLIIVADNERLGDALVNLITEFLSELDPSGLRVRVYESDIHSNRGPARHDHSPSIHIHLVASGKQREQPDMLATHDDETKTERTSRRLGSMLARGYLACHGGRIAYGTESEDRTCTITLTHSEYASASS